MADIKFVSYDGGYPNLCSGMLTLEIDGEKKTFGCIGTGCDYLKFWSSGGRCGFRNNYSDSYIEQDEWIIDKNSLPDELKSSYKEIKELFNENVRWGCCGGCL
jgi:hypothetical protein